jgi:DNA-binding MarR family transcriptional regulator
VTDDDAYAELVMPVLLMEARAAYTVAIRDAFAGAGFDDMPRAGARVIGRIARGGSTVGEVATAYGASRQAGSQLVDALVARGYVERAPDPEDRRRMTLALTERGRAAAAELKAAVDRVDAAWIADVGAEAMWQARVALGRLATLRHGLPAG